jgi:hypothetical protein
MERIKPIYTNVIEENKSNIKCFGYFKCCDCKYFWKNPYTWILYSQKCIKCGTFNNPYSLLDYSDKLNNYEHEKSICSKCEEVGDCSKIEPKEWEDILHVVEIQQPTKYLNRKRKTSRVKSIERKIFKVNNIEKSENLELPEESYSTNFIDFSQCFDDFYYN